MLSLSEFENRTPITFSTPAKIHALVVFTSHNFVQPFHWLTDISIKTHRKWFYKVIFGSAHLFWKLFNFVFYIYIYLNHYPNSSTFITLHFNSNILQFCYCVCTFDIKFKIQMNFWSEIQKPMIFKCWNCFPNKLTSNKSFMHILMERKLLFYKKIM